MYVFNQQAGSKLHSLIVTKAFNLDATYWPDLSLPGGRNVPSFDDWENQ